YRPIGTTDSEHAFCWMLGRLSERWPDAPEDEVLSTALSKLCGELAADGVFNVLLSDGRTLYGCCSNHLVWLTRRDPFGHARLLDEDLAVDFATETTPSDIVTVVTTRPLTTDEHWQALPRRSFIAFRGGAVIHEGAL